MSETLLLEAPIALLPALVFLFVLHHLDSFRLVSLHAALVTLGLGGALAVLSYFVNDAVMHLIGGDIKSYMRYGAPVVEELMKAGVMIYLFQRARIGFLIDAAIIGCAVGTGFALVENVYYLYSWPDANVGVWIVRGFGTAIMHGGATAIFGVLARTWTARHSRFEPLYYLPGLAVAIAIHSLFNHLLGVPMLATGAIMIVAPLTLFFAFAKSEHRIHDWLIKDHDTHQLLLAHLGDKPDSETARFVTDVASRFQDDAADIYAYMRLHQELVLRAEELLLAREAGNKPAITDGDGRAFERLHALERKIGRTAMLALWPHLHYSRQELAELYELETRLKRTKTSPLK